MADTEISWRGLTLGGDSAYIVQSVSGWDDLPDLTDMSQPRVRGHGDHIGDLFAQSRPVTVTGKIADVANRNQLAAALAAVTTVKSSTDPLTIDSLGRQLTAQARVIRRSPSIGLTYSVGEIPFVIQWRCPDPLRYGQPQAPLSTGLPTSGGGLQWPLFAAGVLDWGDPGDPGQITLTNGGDADAPIQAQVIGAVPGGFEISAAGQRITYPVDVPAGQTIYLDTAAGTVLAEGTADRRANLTHADWLTVPAGGSLTLQFTGLGAYDPTARLVVSGFQATYW